MVIDANKEMSVSMGDKHTTILFAVQRDIKSYT